MSPWNDDDDDGSETFDENISENDLSFLPSNVYGTLSGGSRVD